MNAVIYVVLAVIAVLAIIFVVLRKTAGGIPYTEVESLGMADVIKVFKRPEVLEKLKSNENYKAVAVKGTHDDAFTSIVATVFDAEKNEVISEPFCAWKAKMLEADLLEAFGDKSMIILQ